MAKRSSQRSTGKQKLELSESPVIVERVLHIPDECVICQEKINANSVLFHCECIVTVCQGCAMLQVAAQRATYTDGKFHCSNSGLILIK